MQRWPQADGYDSLRALPGMLALTEIILLKRFVGMITCTYVHEGPHYMM